MKKDGNTTRHAKRAGRPLTASADGRSINPPKGVINHPAPAGPPLATPVRPSTASSAIAANRALQPASRFCLTSVSRALRPAKSAPSRSARRAFTSAANAAQYSGPDSPGPSGILVGLIGTRKRLEIAATSTKQSPAPDSNRDKNAYFAQCDFGTFQASPDGNHLSTQGLRPEITASGEQKSMPRAAAPCRARGPNREEPIASIPNLTISEWDSLSVDVTGSWNWRREIASRGAGNSLQLLPDSFGQQGRITITFPAGTKKRRSV